MNDPLTYSLSGMAWSLIGFTMGWISARGALPRNPFKSTDHRD